MKQMVRYQLPFCFLRILLRNASLTDWSDVSGEERDKTANPCNPGLKDRPLLQITCMFRKTLKCSNISINPRSILNLRHRQSNVCHLRIKYDIFLENVHWQ